MTKANRVRSTRRKFLEMSGGLIVAVPLFDNLVCLTANAATVQRNGAGFVIVLDHSDVGKLTAAGGAASIVQPELAPVIDAVTNVITVLDKISGGNGIQIVGVIGGNFFMVLPRLNGVFGTVITRIEDVAGVFTNFIPAVAITQLGITVAGKLFGAGNGSIHADEDAARQEETFSLITTRDGKVAFGSYNGFFTADKDTMHLLANRKSIDIDEKFDLIGNPDGTISLRTWMGTYVTADHNNGKQVVVDRHQIGDWEKFKLEFIGRGTVALKDSMGKYLSVAPG